MSKEVVKVFADQFPGLTFEMEQMHHYDKLCIKIRCKRTGFVNQVEIDNYYARDNDGYVSYAINNAVKSLAENVFKEPYQNGRRIDYSYHDEFNFYDNPNSGCLPGDKGYKIKQKEQPLESEHAGIF